MINLKRRQKSRFNTTVQDIHSQRWYCSSLKTDRFLAVKENYNREADFLTPQCLYLMHNHNAQDPFPYITHTHNSDMKEATGHSIVVSPCFFFFFFPPTCECHWHGVENRPAIECSFKIHSNRYESHKKFKTAIFKKKERLFMSCHKLNYKKDLNVFPEKKKKNMLPQPIKCMFPL